MSDDELDDLLQLEAELAELTDDWTLGAISRTYDVSVVGEEDLADEQTVLDTHGYELASQTLDGGHVHVGRLVLTAGWSILAGKRGIRSDSMLTVAFRKRAAARPETNVLDQVAKLGGLRDAGYLSSEEFEERKRTLLDRL